MILSSLLTLYQDELYIALATTSHQLKVVTADIQWGLPQTNKAVPHSMPLNPSLKEKHLAVTSWFQHGSNEPALDSSMSQLSHIEILPIALQTQHVRVPAVVLTVRTHTPQDPSHFNQEVQSIIDRWELVEEKPAVHPAFARLGAGSGNGASNGQVKPMGLRKLDPIVIPKIVLSIHTMQLGRVICFACSDGTVHYYDRFSMTEIYHELDRNRIMSPHQVGFHFPDPAPCMSPFADCSPQC
jgi:mediator of RNA polymerase II transcription subunit 16, fungi type